MRDPDQFGSYGYLQTWFAEVIPAASYRRARTRKVCFDELYVPPDPGMPWFWNDWSIVNNCSVKSSSELYQSFNSYLLDKWRKGKDHKGQPKQISSPPRNFNGKGKRSKTKFHVVIEAREIDRSKIENDYSSARHIKNIDELIKSIESISSDVKVTSKNFANLTFEEQVSLSHSASIFLSMHGAGTTHIFHSAIGYDNCCALIEMFPDISVDLHLNYGGFSNIARLLGMHAYRYIAQYGSTDFDGTTVDVKVRLIK